MPTGCACSGVAELGEREQEPGRAGAGRQAKGFQAVFKVPSLNGNTAFGLSSFLDLQAVQQEGLFPALTGESHSWQELSFAQAVP